MIYKISSLPLSAVSLGPEIWLIWESQQLYSWIISHDSYININNSLDHLLTFTKRRIHGSDSVLNGEKEIALWFKPEELVSYKSSQFDWVYEKP